MPALVPSDHVARITWLGLVPEEGQAGAPGGGTGLPSVPQTGIVLDWGGPVGERHSGATRPSCARVTSQHPRGTEIANVRQLSVLSAEEIADIASEMRPESLSPHFLGATLVLEGIRDFTHVPPSSRLQAENGATLVIDMENRPCVLPGREIEAQYPGLGARFKAAAKGRRGVTAWVERPGALALGDALRLHVPDQRGWQPGML